MPDAGAAGGGYHHAPAPAAVKEVKVNGGAWVVGCGCGLPPPRNDTHKQKETEAVYSDYRLAVGPTCCSRGG